MKSKSSVVIKLAISCSFQEQYTEATADTPVPEAQRSEISLVIVELCVD